MSGNGIINRILKRIKPEDKSVPEEFRAYYRSREIAQKKYLCHAPFNNMYFNSLGDVANCWLTFDDPEHYDGTRSIREIWFGEKFTRLRSAIKQYDLDFKCKTCKHHLEAGNHVNVLAKAYDNEFPLVDYPTMMEFELTNTCNLECTMCTGLLSSAIRKNRENLPALKSPYGDKFVEDLREFIPHLHEARFNGGEPFLIHIYYKIWDLIHEIKPDLKIVVATNGTTLTPRVKKYLERGNFHINISIDSLDQQTYSEVRVNGNLLNVLENFKYFKDYCNRRGSTICVMVNPMRQNWRGMGDFVNFCNREGVHLWYNTIIRPYDQAIWNLPAVELEQIYTELSSFKIEPNTNTPKGMYAYNIGVFENLVHKQIKVWHEEALEREKENKNTISAYEPFPEKKFKEYLENFLRTQFKEHNSEAEAARKALYEKIELIDSYVEGKLQPDVFYRMLNSNNPASVFIFLLENDSEKIKESIDRFVLQQN